MRRAMALLTAALLLGGCALPRRASLPRKPQTAELFIAVGHDCPPTAADALMRLCDDAARLSDGGLRIALQYWADPFSSQADLVFALTDALSADNAELAALGTEFLFQSAQQGDEAMNAQTILEMITQTLAAQSPPAYTSSNSSADSIRGVNPVEGTAEAFRYEAASSFYCGRTFLLTGDARLAAAMRSDDSQTTAEFAQSVREGDTALRPLDLTQTPQDGTLYTAGTDALAALEPGDLAEYTLVDLPYRCRFGVLFLDGELEEKIGAARRAAILEAMASAKPRCLTAYERTDRAILDACEAIQPSVKLRRSLRGDGDESSERDPVRNTALYQELINYTD